MSDEREPTAYGPGTRWLAGRTRRRPEELTQSASAAVSALGDAIREVAGLAARLESRDPQVRAAAQAEADALRERIASEPSPGERLGTRLAQVLRDAAQRLEHPRS
ncbi:hypothetical protein ACFQU3_21585 [Terrabacter sp. GCM10028922]|uniref:hypothetical protein n=1 Tax=Terrabacter sp. GCM10028922 TaxID=3273428 RepID=UPI0036095DC4